MTAETPSYMFGAVQHAVKMYDRFGNSRPDVPVAVSMVINSSPTAPNGLTKNTYDSGNDQMMFTFDGSAQLA